MQMAKHEFGVMDIAPRLGERYDTYEPQKYDCILVEDDDILPILEQLQEIDFYWHTLDVSEKGLAYYGVTLISPEASKRFLAKIDNMAVLSALKTVLEKAIAQNKFVIHFGI